MATGKFFSSYTQATFLFLKSRTLMLLLATEATLLFAFEMTSPFNAIYFVEVLGGQRQWVGLVESLFFAALTLFTIPLGLLVRHLSTRQALGGYYAVGLMSLLMRAVWQSPIGFIASRLVQGPAGAFNSFLPDAVIMGVVPGKDLGKALSGFQTVTSLFAIAAPIIGGVIALRFGYSSAFLVGAFLSAIALVLTRLFPQRALSEATERSPDDKKPVQSLISLASRPQIMWLLLFTFVRAVSLGALNAYLVLYFREALHFSPMAIGFYFAALDILTVSLAIPLGGLVDRYPQKYFLAADAITDLVFATASVIHPSPFLTVATALVSKVGSLPSSTALSVLMAKRTVDSDRSSILAVQSFARYAGYIVGPLTGGVIFAVGLSYVGLFGFFAVCALVLLGISQRPEFSLKLAVSITQ